MLGRALDGNLANMDLDLCTSDFNGWNLPPAVMQYLVQNVAHSSKILELGSGKSTRELSKFFDVTAIEEDLAVVGVESRARYLHAPVDKGYYEKSVLRKALEDNEYDAIIIDGPKAFPGFRKRFIRLGFIGLFNFVRGNPLIVIDDVQRIPELLLVLRLSFGRRIRVYRLGAQACAIIHRENADVKALAAVLLMCWVAFRQVLLYVSQLRIVGGRLRRKKPGVEIN